MHVDVWNAYASNNSGAYTIVGTFSSPAEAAAMVDLLRPVLAEQARWEEHPVERGDDEEPLRRFAEEQGLPLEEPFDWPEYGSDKIPKVASVGHQVILHHPYTISLPRFFGHLFYARGGRVDVELDHTHHPLVVLISVWWPSGTWEPGENEERARGVLEALTATGGPLVVAEELPAPTWRFGKEFGEPPLMVGAVFGDDLVERVAHAQEVLRHFAAQGQIRLIEALAPEGDPLAFMRDVSG